MPLTGVREEFTKYLPDFWRVQPARFVTTGKPPSRKCQIQESVFKIAEAAELQRKEPYHTGYRIWTRSLDE
jgi:hypothetical protein